MKSGSIVLARIQQADGRIKARPVVILQEMPPFSDLLVCAVSSQLRHACHGFDTVLESGDEDFLATGLKVSSLIRLSLITTIPKSAILGKLGVITSKRLQTLRTRLAKHIDS